MLLIENKPEIVIKNSLVLSTVKNETYQILITIIIEEIEWNHKHLGHSKQTKAVIIQNIVNVIV